MSKGLANGRKLIIVSLLRDFEGVLSICVRSCNSRVHTISRGVVDTITDQNGVRYKKRGLPLQLRHTTTVRRAPGCTLDSNTVVVEILCAFVDALWLVSLSRVSTRGRLRLLRLPTADECEAGLGDDAQVRRPAAHPFCSDRPCLLRHLGFQLHLKESASTKRDAAEGGCRCSNGIVAYESSLAPQMALRRGGQPPTAQTGAWPRLLLTLLHLLLSEPDPPKVFSDLGLAQSSLSVQFETTSLPAAQANTPETHNLQGLLCVICKNKKHAQRRPPDSQASAKTVSEGLHVGRTASNEAWVKTFWAAAYKWVGKRSDVNKSPFLPDMVVAAFCMHVGNACAASLSQRPSGEAWRLPLCPPTPEPAWIHPGGCRLVAAASAPFCGERSEHLPGAYTPDWRVLSLAQLLVMAQA